MCQVSSPARANDRNRTDRSSPVTVPALVTTDNAKEYTANYVKNFMAQRGINLRPTTPYTPQENAIAERINRTIMNSARAALTHSKLPPSYWEEVSAMPRSNTT